VALDCLHLVQLAEASVDPATPGCAPCAAAGETWVHLRQCQTCGHVGCCDMSPGKHASRHYRESHHPVARSVEPGETWSWCYVDAVEYDPRYAEWEEGADLG
jgi:uncharacterized UBP type Zn finger protein